MESSGPPLSPWEGAARVGRGGRFLPFPSLALDPASEGQRSGVRMASLSFLLETEPRYVRCFKLEVEDAFQIKVVKSDVP